MSRPAPRFALLRRALGWVERRPMFVLVVPTVLALGAIAGLADLAGAERIDRAARHLHPVWLVLCFFGEAVAYFGYVLAVRDTAKVDQGPKLSFGHSIRAVIGGFGVFAARAHVLPTVALSPRFSIQGAKPCSAAAAGPLSP